MRIALLLFFLSLTSTLAYAASNLIYNGDFKDGIKDFGFSDDAPDKLNVRIEKLSDTLNSLTYSAEENGLGGLNMSEVKVLPNGVYNFSFKAKASVPLKIRLIAMSNGHTVYRCELKTFDIGTEWKTYSYRLDIKSLSKRGVDTWIPFRFEKVSKVKADLSFADIRFEPCDGKSQPPLANAKIAICAPEGVLEKIKNKFTGRCSSGSLIFGKGSNMDVVVEGYKAASGEKKLRYEWKIKNAKSDKYVAEGAEDIDSEEGKFKKNVSIKAPSENGIYVLESRLDGGDVLSNTFAVSPRVRTGVGVLPVDIGYCGVLTNGELGKPSPEEMAYLADSGISYIRTWDSGNPFNWRVLEPEEGKYYWEITDETVRLARKNGLKVLPVLGGMFFIYPPEMGLRGHRQADWLYAKSEVARTMAGFERQGRMAIKPPLADWERMVEAVAKRYKGKIRHYEIMNEPNIIWRDYSTYCQYLESAYRILKKVDKRNKIVAYSTTGDYGGNLNGFIDTMLKLGFGKYADIASFHSYNHLYEDSASNGKNIVKKFKDNLAEYNVEVPLWHTELYYLNPLCKGGGDHKNGPRFHPGYLIRRYMLDAASGVEASILLPASTVATKLGTNCKVSNFLKGRYMPYPSIEQYKFLPNERFIVSAVFAEILYGMKFSNERSLGDGLLAYEFVGRKSEKAVAALFALGCYMENVGTNKYGILDTKIVDSMNRKPLNLGEIPSGIEIVDIFGNDVKPGADGKVTIPVSPVPVYIKAENKVLLDDFLGRIK